MQIALLLKKWRLINDIDMKRLSGEIGISAATLYRIEAGHDVDGATLMKIFNWLTAKERNKDG